MKNLKIYNIKENEEYKLSREYPKIVTNGCFGGLLAGILSNYDYITAGNQLPIKNFFINLSIFVGTGAIVAGVVYSIFYPVFKKLHNEKPKDNEQNDNDKQMVLKKKI